MKKLLYLWIMLTGITACVNPQTEQMLAEAERLMQAHPDSALHRLDEASGEVAGYPRKYRMRYLLLRAEAMNKAYLSLDTVTYMDEVFRYYQSHGNADEQMRACYLMGNIYRDQGNSPLALQYFRDAISVADTARADCNYAQVSRIYAQMAFLFHLQRYPQMELMQWKQAMHYACLAKDTLMYIQCQERMGGAYYMMNKEDSVLAIARKAYDDYIAFGKEDWAAATLLVVADYYLKHDSLAQAKQAIDEYRIYSGLFHANGEIMDGHEIFYAFVGEYYEKASRLDSALFYYRKLLEYPTDWMNLENGYKGLMSVYRRMCLPDSVVKYSRLYADANDSANFYNSAGEISRMQALYDYSESQRIAVRKSEEVRRLWHTIYMGMGILACLALFVYRHYQKQKDRLLEETKSANRKYFETLQKYQDSVDELKHVKTDRKQFLQTKDREIKQLQEKLASYQEKDSHPEKWELEQSLLQHDIVRHMHECAYRIIVPSDSEWEDLRKMAFRYLPGFCAWLDQYAADLSGQEWKVCLLTKLNFIPTEIAILLDTTKQRVSNIRKAVNLKLFGKQGSRTFDDNIHRL